MDKIINILLLVIIFVFDPLAISLVVAANFAFDHANRKNLYDEYEDELEEDLWDNFEEEDINDIEVESEQVLPDEARGLEPSDWKVVDENDNELVENKIIEKVLQKGPSRNRVLYKDGTTGWLPKTKEDDNKITYL
jgi:hypothetical protein